ncbi:MAG TPA: DUF4199 domain-containing protein [Cyclobacteriaceae bacterium]|nr:DUF4199 domain-containing protein [Cyclobacteriaceae bacterium]
MEEAKSVTTSSAGIRYGLFYGLVSIALFIIMSITGMDMQSGLVRVLSSAVFIAFIYLAHKYFKDEGNGFMSYGQGVGIGLFLSLVGGVISSVFTFIYIKFIDDSMMQQIMDKARYDMEERGMSDEQIDQAMEFSAMFMSPMAMLIFGIVGAVFIGLILSLIVSIFTQKKDTSFGM